MRLTKENPQLHAKTKDNTSSSSSYEYQGHDSRISDVNLWEEYRCLSLDWMVYHRIGSKDMPPALTSLLDRYDDDELGITATIAAGRVGIRITSREENGRVDGPSQGTVTTVLDGGFPEC